MNILIVRLGALGDIVHAVPAAAAIRRSMPDARIDWLVDAKHKALLDLVPVVDRIVPLGGRTATAWIDAVRRLRAAQYDVALDLQGLLKSAVLARASGARRVIGFSIYHLREKTARPFYSETDGERAAAEHVIHKNLRLLRTIGIDSAEVEFPFARTPSAARESVRATVGERPFALINPGAAWPNKRWPADRFGQIAAFLRDVRGLTSVVLWGPGEQGLAEQVVAASNGGARLGPPTTIADLVELSREAALLVSGDTGPLHIAAAMGTPIVALFGPTDPTRNGPWSPTDVVVSRHGVCGCHYERRCRRAQWCLADISVTETTAAIQQRLASAGAAHD